MLHGLETDDCEDRVLQERLVEVSESGVLLFLNRVPMSIEPRMASTIKKLFAGIMRCNGCKESGDIPMDELVPQSNHPYTDGWMQSE